MVFQMYYCLSNIVWFLISIYDNQTFFALHEKNDYKLKDMIMIGKMY